MRSKTELVTYRIWARLFTLGGVAFLLVAFLIFWSAAGGIWFNGGALNP